MAIDFACEPALKLRDYQEAKKGSSSTDAASSIAGVDALIDFTRIGILAWQIAACNLHWLTPNSQFELPALDQPKYEALCCTMKHARFFRQDQ